jgi:ATP synthase in type III secretion protein N
MEQVRFTDTLTDADTVQAVGRVHAVVGLAIHAMIPGVRLGEVVTIQRRGLAPLLAEVSGFQDDRATLLPLGELKGVGPDDTVQVTGDSFQIRFGPDLLGRVLDGLGQPMDGGPPLTGGLWDVMRPPPPPLSRPRIKRALSLGVRAIDGLLTLGEGQRIGLFAGSGVGKTSLLAQLARQADADVFVLALVGERGRELSEVIESALGTEGLARGVVVCATSDSPALVRMKSAYVATAIAEGFREQGKRVVLLMDSVTRFARAAREVGLASGEAPVRRGYPPSVFALLPGLLERSGTSERGSITGIYTVLVEGDDLDEPIADEVRGILDGHLVLRRDLMQRGRLPAIDVVASLSRVMSAVTSEPQRRAARELIELIAAYEAKRDLVMLGAYKPGSDPRVDRALSRLDAIEAFLRQRQDEPSEFAATLSALSALVKA